MTPLGRWRERRRLEAEDSVLDALGPTAAGWSHTPGLKERSGLRWGRFYTALYRLEEAGLVEAKWDDSEQPPPKYRRRMYRLTAQSPHTYP